MQDHLLKDIPAGDVSAEVWRSDNPYVTKLEVNVQLEVFTFPSGESIPSCFGTHPGTHSSRLQSLLKEVFLAETCIEAWPCSNWLWRIENAELWKLCWNPWELPEKWNLWADTSCAISPFKSLMLWLLGRKWDAVWEWPKDV